MESIKNISLFILLFEIFWTPKNSAEAEVTIYTDNKDFRDVVINSNLPSGSLVSDTLRYVFARLKHFPRIYHFHQTRADLALAEP